MGFNLGFKGLKISLTITTLKSKLHFRRAWQFNEDITESEDNCNPEEEIPVQVRIFMTQTGVTNCYLGKENNIKWTREIHRPQRSELRCTMPNNSRNAIDKGIQVIPTCVIQHSSLHYVVFTF